MLDPLDLPLSKLRLPQIQLPAEISNPRPTFMLSHCLNAPLIGSQE
jgi:hypothetical protein